FFARSAHGLPPFGNPEGPPLELPAGYGLDAAELLRLEEQAPLWADEVAEWLARGGFAMARAPTPLQPTHPRPAPPGRLKRARPDLITIIGGANCDGLMAHGMDSIPSTVDHIFSGESESAFPEFLRAVAAGQRPAGRIVQGAPCRDLDAIPTPDFSEF